jgi:FkbM family methyltransferase
MDSPFWHYNSSFDAVDVMRRFAVIDPAPMAGMAVNFLGVAIDPRIFPPALAERAGTVEPIPLPANWHADIAEWGAALRAVDLSGPRFTMIELGCGWGCWMNNMGAAARSTGRDIHVIGVEGDVGHIAFAHEALARNGFTPDQWTVVNGIAAGRHGVALFPRQDHAGASWGLEPVFGATDEQRDAAVASGSHDVLPMIPLDQIAGAYDRIDLLHIDIQGGEADLIEECLPTLNEKVAYVVVGTHSRQIEGRLFDMMLAAVWLLEMERPAILSVAGPSPVVTVDGLQGWRNRRMLP